MPVITEEQRTQFREEGYFILERAVSEEQLKILREACDHLIEAMHAEMDRLGTDHIHISHRHKRYHIAKQYDQAPRLDEFVFSELMAEICRATLGDTAFLFYDQYVVKAAEQGMAFSWHQDSGYLGFPHTPYVTCWTAVDDMTLANGTAHVMPFSHIGIATWSSMYAVTKPATRPATSARRPGCRRLCQRAAWWCSARSASIAAARIPPIKCAARPSLNIRRKSSGDRAKPSQYT